MVYVCWRLVSRLTEVDCWRMFVVAEVSVSPPEDEACCQ